MDDSQISSRFTFKFLIVGDGSVGKTSIVRRLTRNDFDTDTEATVGVEFITHVITVDNTAIKLQIWDTAGQEKYRSVGKAYYRDAVGVLLVFSLTSHESFESLSEWLEDVRPFCHKSAKIVLIGNKSDLSDKREVTTSEAQNFATSNNLDYFETSALANKNITEAFYQVADEVYSLTISDVIGPNDNDFNFDSTNDNDSVKKQRCC